MSEAPNDRQSQRRAARREGNRLEILDAAERVFGAEGLRDGSLRKIAAESGFSSAAIYLFFDSKDHLVAETFTRRADELITVVRAAAGADLTPLERLHRIVDDTVTFFDERPAFRQLLGHPDGGAAVVGSAFAGTGIDEHGQFDEVMSVIAGIVRDGQRAGEVRDGDERALAHLFSVLVNEFVLLASSARGPGAGSLTPGDFHAFVDGALRAPTSSSGR